MGGFRSDSSAPRSREWLETMMLIRRFEERAGERSAQHSAYAEVPYPPPAAMVEVVPVSPSSALVWLDGSWTWQGQYYLWMRGGWVFVLRAGITLTGNHFTRTMNIFMFAPSAWYSADGKRIRPPAIQLPAYTHPTRSTRRISNSALSRSANSIEQLLST